MDEFDAAIQAFSDEMERQRELRGWPQERVERLETAFVKLVGALERKETERDGNWGWPSFESELSEIAAAIRSQP